MRHILSSDPGKRMLRIIFVSSVLLLLLGFSFSVTFAQTASGSITSSVGSGTGVSDTLTITVVDNDFFGNGTIDINVFTSSGDQEIITATEVEEATFEVVVDPDLVLFPTIGNDIVEILNGDQVTFSYDDEDSTPNPSVTVLFQTPGPFDLTSPGSESPEDATVIGYDEYVEWTTGGFLATWDEPTEGQGYIVEITGPEGSTSYGTSGSPLTPPSGDDEVVCSSNECFFQLTGGETATVFEQDGEYSWTVTAINDNEEAPPLRFGESNDLLVSPDNQALYFEVRQTAVILYDTPGTITDINGMDIAKPPWSPAAPTAVYDFLLTGPVITIPLQGLVCDLNDDNNDGLELITSPASACVLDFDFTQLTSNGLYTWDVFAVDDGGTPETEDDVEGISVNGPFEFVVDDTTNNGPGAFTLLDPVDGDFFNRDAIAAFTSPDGTGFEALFEVSSGATIYDFSLEHPDGTLKSLPGLTPALGDDELDCDDDCNLIIPPEDIPDLLADPVDGEYSWTVTASDGTKITTANEPHSFTVDTIADVEPFLMLEPGDNYVPGPLVDVSSGITATWSDASADSYQVNMTLPDGTVVDAWVISDPSSACFSDGQNIICEQFMEAVEFPQEGVYLWDVDAIDEDGNSNVADNSPFWFYVDGVDGPGAFDLVSPTNFFEVNDISSVTAITWDESDAATSYDFFLNTPSVPASPGMTNLTPADDIDDDLVCAAGTCTLTVDGSSLLTEDGTYTWDVIANDASASTISTNGPFSFNVDTATDPPIEFTLITPEDGTTIEPRSVDVSTTWTEAVGADSYIFALTQDDVFVYVNDALGPEICTEGVCSFSLPSAQLATEGAYSWTVTASNSIDQVDASNGPFSLYVDDPLAGPGAFALQTPADNTNFTTIADFTAATWEVAGGAETYNLTINKPDGTTFSADGLTPAVDDPTPDALECTTTGTADTCTYTVSDPNVILDENGEYTWNVEAVNTDGSTFATQFSFELSVDVVVITPPEFNLLTPDNNALVRDPAEITINWQESISTDETLAADSYDFSLIQISSNPLNPRVGEVISLTGLTPASGDDELNCVVPEGGTTSVCTLDVAEESDLRGLDNAAFAGLENGLYSWTVVATMDGTSALRATEMTRAEAANGPFFFSVNTGDVELLTNGGFEINEDKDKIPDGWKLKANNGGDAIKCNKTLEDGTVKVKANSGECAFQIKGTVQGVKTRLQQNVNEASFLQSGDTITVSFFAKIKVPANIGIAKIVVKSNDIGENGKPEKDKLTLRAPESPVGTAYEQINDEVTLTVSNIQKFKVQLFYRGGTGKIFYDDVSAVLNAGAGSALDGLLPLPEAPPSFRN